MAIPKIEVRSEKGINHLYERMPGISSLLFGFLVTCLQLDLIQPTEQGTQKITADSSDLEIFTSYFFDPRIESIADLARRTNKTHSEVETIVDRVLKQLYTQTEMTNRERFSRTELLAEGRKNTTVVRIARFRPIIVPLIKAGHNLTEITAILKQRHYKISPATVSRYMEHYKQELDISDEHFTRPVESTVEKFRTLLQEERVPGILDQVTAAQFRAGKRVGIFVNILSITRNGKKTPNNKFYFSTRELHHFTTALTNAEIPWSKIDELEEYANGECFFLLAADAPRAITTFENDPQTNIFMEPTLNQVAGPGDASPAFMSEFTNKAQFSRVAPLLRQIGVGVSKPYKDAQLLEVTQIPFWIEDSPVPVFQYQSSFGCRVEDADSLRAHFEKKARLLRVTQLLDL